MAILKSWNKTVKQKTEKQETVLGTKKWLKKLEKIKTRWHVAEKI